MQLPSQTADIFAWLSQGLFINMDSQQGVQRDWYLLLEQHFELYRDYFEPLGFTLSRGTGYYYFSCAEATPLLEERVEKSYRYFDWLEICWALDPDFGPGFQFDLSELAVRLSEENQLLRKVRKLALRGNPQTAEEMMRALLREMSKGGFVERTDEKAESYKVLAAFDYLVQLVQRIQFKSSE